MTKRRILYIIIDDMSTANISFCVAREALRTARAVKGLVRALSAVPDFRMDRRKRHRLVTILAIPKLVRRLFLEGAVLTFDAMGCQREVAAACREAGADYLLPLKDNQPTVNDEVTRFMRHVRDADPKSLTYSGTVGKGHGRLVRRRAWQSRDVSWFEDRAKWRDLAGFVMIETSRWEGGKWTDPDVRCYLTSLAADARRLRRIARAHWGSRTVCTGSSTSCSARTTAARGAASPRRT